MKTTMTINSNNKVWGQWTAMVKATTIVDGEDNNGKQSDEGNDGWQQWVVMAKAIMMVDGKDNNGG